MLLCGYDHGSKGLIILKEAQCNPVVMNIVLSLGGSILLPDLHSDQIDEYASVIRELVGSGHSLSVVTGGGFIAREYIESARELGANEIELDDLGIAVTRLNARLLCVALGDAAVLSPPTTYEAAKEALNREKIPVMGGVAPAQTTDAVSAALAEYVNAELLVYATSVPGVFTSDPSVDDSATRFDTLSANELVSTIAELGMDAGSNAPVDLLAAKIIQRAGIESIVLDGSDPSRVARAIQSGEFDGTRVVKEGAESPQHELREFDR